jgi:hypothetical protein
VSRLPANDPVFRFFWALDSYVSTAVFELVALMRRWGSAFSSFLYRFRLSGFRRLIVDLSNGFQAPASGGGYADGKR